MKWERALANIQSRGCQMVLYFLSHCKYLFYFHNAGYWLRNWYSEVIFYNVNSNCLHSFSLPTILVYWYVVSCFLFNIQFSKTEADAFLMYLYGFFNDELIIHGPWVGFWSSTIVQLHSNDVALNWDRNCGLKLKYSFVLYIIPHISLMSMLKYKIVKTMLINLFFDIF